MSTIVFFHAHPDDEAITTAGTMAQLSAAGHRVVLVVATRGEHGEPVEGILDDAEQLGVRRVSEAFESARILGVARVELLGYVDSGMVGSPFNDAPYAFCHTPLDPAARRLATILEEESADVLVTYDERGGYGHPDHIAVHRVGHRAAEFAGTAVVYEVTHNRDRMRELMKAAAEFLGEDEVREIDDDFGSAAAEITHAIDVSDQIATKRAALRSHRSQISESTFFLKMDDGQFTQAFGTEWFIRVGQPREPGAKFATELLAGS
jgi:LmbE family N-acetylglucosaminyl deacetylase